VVHDAVAIGKRVAVAARERQAPRRRLLVGVADRSLERRPRVAVARIERVVDLADVVRPAALVEARGIGATEQLPAGDLVPGDVRIDRLRRRREVIGVVAALLVEIDGDLRLELEADRDAAARLGLRLRKPVAIHVEEIVVAASARPRLVVLRGIRHGVGVHCASQRVRGNEARAAVGVLHRVDQHQRITQHQVDARVTLGGEQMVGLDQRRVGRRDLVAVHAMNQPHDHRQLTRQPIALRRRRPPRVGESLDIGLQLIEPGDAIRAADHEQPQRPAFPAGRVLNEARFGGRRFLQCLQVLRDAFRRRDYFAMVVTKYLLNRWDYRVVLRTGPECRFLR
jgi:hypothetical protein